MCAELALHICETAQQPGCLLHPAMAWICERPAAFRPPAHHEFSLFRLDSRVKLKVSTGIVIDKVIFVKRNESAPT